LSDERWLRIDWDPEHSCVYAEWKAFANSSEFRASTTKILDAIRARRADSFVSDNRRLEGIADQDQLWLRDTWVPMAVAAGVKRIAVVVPHHGLGKIASEEGSWTNRNESVLYTFVHDRFRGDGMGVRNVTTWRT
jgi:hypothetical protein